MQRQAGDQEEGVGVHQQVTWGIKQSRQTSFYVSAESAIVRASRVCVN